MNDFNEDILHEYLDGALSPQQQRDVEAWLAQSAAARQRLAELAAVFSALDELADVPLTRDLSAGVVRQLEAKVAQTAPAEAPWPRWLLAAQLTAAVAMLAWLWPTLLAGWQSTQTAVSQFVAGQQWTLPEMDLAAQATAVWQQLPPAPTFNLALGHWGLLLALAFLAWLVGNRLLLTNNNGGPTHG